MSTILKSLRKLEEEKRTHEKKLNLRDLMIREDRRPPIQSVLNGNPRRWGSGLLLIGTGLAVAVFMFMLMMPAGKTASTTTVPQSGERTAQAASQSSAAKQTGPKLAGVPLSSIPDYSPKKAPAKMEAARPAPAPMKETAPPANPEPATAPAPTAASVAEEPVPQPIPQQEAAESAPADQEIIAALEQVPAQKRTAMEPSPTLPIIRPLSSEEIIPGLKLKGIVFFGEGSEENYLFFTLPGLSIHRLKVGETVMEAKLIEIHPGLAVFDYEGRRVELRVGG